MNALEVAEVQVGRFIDKISSNRRTPSLLSFPRNPETLAQLAYPHLGVSVERISALSDLKITAHLRNVHGYRGLKAQSEEILMGFIIAPGLRYCVIYANPDFGPAAERFTLAHEIGHLELEIAPRMSPGQASLFLSEAEQTLRMSRDTPLSLPIDENVGPRVRPPKNELFANMFAAALLMPEREARRVIPKDMDFTEQQRQMMVTFGVSAAASRVRLQQLGLTARTDPASVLFPA